DMSAATSIFQVSLGKVFEGVVESNIPEATQESLITLYRELSQMHSSGINSPEEGEEDIGLLTLSPMIPGPNLNHIHQLVQSVQRHRSLLPRLTPSVAGSLIAFEAWRVFIGICG
ncbi:unnamed protein product, partial [Meganyctiphanes norvegica]